MSESILLERLWEKGGTQSKQRVTCRVKVAEDEATKVKYAMKIMKKEDAENHEEFNLQLFISLLSNEVGKLKDLPSHPNIV